MTASTPQVELSSIVISQPDSVAVQRNRTLIRWWLYLICLLVLSMVVVGGATRLTESGLSITEWKPIHGVIPPLNEQEWMQEFDKYQQIPEYRLINKGMSLDEFKFIFWWEWAHRLLGRFIGVVFFLPLVVFWVQGRIESWLKPWLVLGLVLGGLQGAVGWWMVASGLVERTDVSQYRLAIHLTFACIIFAYLFGIARRLSLREAATAQVEAVLSGFGKVVLGVVFLQIFLGGLVAGMDAGLTFNTWPLMDGQIIPRGLFAMSPFWLNFFENVMTVQFQHRMTAYLLVACVIYLVVRSHKAGAPSQVMRASHLLAGFVGLQVLFGILTLVNQVPLHLALWHQAFALIVLAGSVDYLAALKGAFPVRK